VRRRTIRLHGQELSYFSAGHGPLLVLVHGIAGSAETWRACAPLLARRFSLIVPDLLGHGSSAKPRGDYSLGAFASGIRDLLVAGGHDRATFVGHSMGGGIAMQLAYQFPEMCERLVLVSSGGLGREVSLMLRAAALPGADLALRLGAARAARLLPPTTQLSEVARSLASLAEKSTRQAFLHTLRAVIDANGQRVSALDRLYLAAEVPTLIVWGERDRIIPVRHGRAAHGLIPGSRLVVFPRAGHFPHLEEPVGFAAALTEFLDSTRPTRLDRGRLRRRLRSGR